MNNTERVEYIDLLRGIGIILMTIGHVGFTVNIEKWIYAFHMPLFYCVSGWFFNNHSTITAKIKKLSLKLLVPYFSFGLMYYFIWILVNFASGIQNKNIMDPLSHLLFINTDGVPISPALWFLTSLFWVEIIYAVLDKIFQNKIFLLSIVIIVLAVLGTGLPSYFGVRLPWALDTAFVGIGFYHLARVLKNTIKYPISTSPTIKCFGMAVILLTVATFSAFINGYVNMRRGLYSSIPLFWINAVMMILSIWVIVLLTSKYVNNKCFQWIKTIGKNSITYVCLNHLVVKALLILALKSGHNGLIVHGLILLVSLGILWILDFLFRKTLLKVFLGQW